MLHQPLCGQLLVFSAWFAVVGVWVDADSAARKEQTYNFNVFRLHQLNEVFHYYVDAILMEIAVVAETEQIEFQTLALNHLFVGQIHYLDFGKIGLAGYRA